MLVSRELDLLLEGYLIKILLSNKFLDNSAKLILCSETNFLGSIGIYIFKKERRYSKKIA